MIGQSGRPSPWQWRASVASVSRSDCSSAIFAQPQRVADHRDRRQAHRRRGDHRRQQRAEHRDRACPPRPARRARCRRRRRTGSADVAHRRLASLRARTMPRRSPFTSVMPALSIATSAPVPMAMPTSAAASAGASLMPSPAMATCGPGLQLVDQRLLVLRQTPGAHLVDAERPRRRPPPCAHCRRSP
jgi:hypothetical protein